MKITNLFLFLGFGLVVLTTSCKKDHPNPGATSTPTTQLTAAESTNLLNNTAALMKADVKDMRESEGAKKLESISYSTNKVTTSPFGRIASNDYQNTLITLNGSSSLELFKNLFVIQPTSSINGRTQQATFDFVANKGIYTWNDANQAWDKASSSSKIEINFPTDSLKMNVNDGKLTISNYDEKLIIKDIQEYDYNLGMMVTVKDTTGIPTSIIANLTVAGSELASINYTGTFSNDGIPTLLNAKVFIKPWHFEASGVDNGSSASSSYKVYKNSDAPITSTSLTVTFDQGNKQKPVLGSGYVQYRDLRVAGAVMAKEIMAAASDTTVSDAKINEWINFDVLRNSDLGKLADIWIQKDNNTNPVVIKLNDGTIKTPEDYFQPVIDEINSYLK